MDFPTTLAPLSLPTAPWGDVLRALIGHTGFVGSNLLKGEGFDATFNSRNSSLLAGRSFDEIICAGVSAAKWIANVEPDADRKAIAALTSILEQASIGRFVLISTIDVYPDPSQSLDEACNLVGQPNHPYGRHRLELEKWVRSRYSDSLIVRLPALFGPGLRKNALYDLLHGNDTEKINPAGVFQWYPVARLNSDIAIAASAGLRLINLFTAPVAIMKIVQQHFAGIPLGPERLPGPRYALKTRHAALFGGENGYIMNEEQEVQAIADFIADERDRLT